MNVVDESAIPKNSRIDWLSVLIIIIANIIIAAVPRLINFIGYKEDKKYYRKKKIIDIAIYREAMLYGKLEKLTHFWKGEEHQMLCEIMTVEKYMANNRIYFSKKIFDKAQKLLDYFKRINSDLTHKNVMEEEKLLIDLQKELGYE